MVSLLSAMAISPGLTVGDRILENADLVDLDLDLVAGLHPERGGAPRAHAARRAGDQHVARDERGPGRHVFDDLRDLEDHLLGARVLHALAVQPAGECHRGAGRDLIRGDHPWPEAPVCAKFLPAVHWMVWRCQ